MEMICRDENRIPKHCSFTEFQKMVKRPLLKGNFKNEDFQMQYVQKKEGKSWECSQLCSHNYFINLITTKRTS